MNIASTWQQGTSKSQFCAFSGLFRVLLPACFMVVFTAVTPWEIFDFLADKAWAAPWSSAQICGPSWGTAFGDPSRNAVKSGTVPVGETRLAWRYPLGGKWPPAAQTVISEGIVFIATDEPALMGVNLEDGSLIWKTLLESPVLGPDANYPTRTGLLASGSAIVASGHGYAAVFDAFTGDSIGNFEPNSGKIELFEVSGEYAFMSISPPVTPDGPAINNEFEVLAMNLVSAKVFKVLKTSRPGFILPAGRRFLWGNFGGVFVLGEHGASNLSLRRPDSLYAFSEDELFFFSQGQAVELVCLDTLSGREKWVSRIYDSPAGPPVITGSTVLVSTEGSRIYSLFRKTGTVHWIHQYPALESGDGSSATGTGMPLIPLCDGVRVAVCSGQTVHIFSLATGQAENPVIVPFASRGPRGIETVIHDGRMLVPLFMEDAWSLGCFKELRKP